MAKKAKTKYDAGDSGRPLPAQYDRDLVVELMDALYSRMTEDDLGVNNTAYGLMTLLGTIFNGVPAREDRIRFYYRGTGFSRFLHKAFPHEHRVWQYMEHNSDRQAGW